MRFNATTGPPRRDAAAPGRWVLAGLAVLAYGLWFYTQPLPSLPLREGRLWRRFELLEFLLVPDALYEQWLGGSAAPALADRVRLLLVALGLAVAAALVGRLLVRVLKIERHLSWAEAWWFSSVLGSALVGYLTWCAGLWGMLQQPVWLLAALGVGAVKGAALAVRSEVNAMSSPAADGESLPNPLPCPAWWLAVPFVVVLVLGGVLPPVEFDVREYHLQAPKEFFQSGRVQFLPHNVYANMPLLAEMWALAGMVVCADWWRGALVGKLLMGGMSLLVAWGLLLVGRRFHSPFAGMAGAVVYLSVPWVVRLSASGFNEPAVACFGLAAWFAAAIYRDAASDERKGNSSLALLAGLAAGSAVACKYPSAVLVATPVGAWLIASPSGGRVRNGVAYLVGWAVTCGPWLVKNAIATGNPVYPLMGSWFGGGDWTAEQIARWNAAHAPGTWTMSALLDSVREVAGASEWSSPLVWPLTILALVIGWRRAVVRRAALYVLWVLVCWWGLTHRVDRFWFPAMPLVCLLAGVGAAEVACHTWGRRAIGVLGGAVLAVNLLFASLASPGYYNRFLMPLVDARQDPWRVSVAQRWLNQVFRAGRLEGRAVLAVGEAEVFDLEPPVTYATAFDACVLETRVRGRTDEEIRAALAPYAFVLVRWDELARYRSPGNYGYSDFVSRELLARLVAAGLLGPPLFRDPPADEFGTDQQPRVEIFPVLPGWRR